MTHQIDFQFTGHGSVATIEAVSEEAKEFARENFDVEGWQGIPERFTTDWRPAIALVEQLAEDGFRISAQ